MNLPTCITCLVIAASFSTASANETLKSPAVVKALAPLTTASQPTVDDARVASMLLMEVAGKLDSAYGSYVTALVAQVKAPFIAEADLLAKIASIPAAEAALVAAKTKLANDRVTPPLDVRRQPNYIMWKSIIERGESAVKTAQLALEAPDRARLALVRQLASTNSLIAEHLRSQHLDACHALASCLFAIQRRHQLQLDFEPSVSPIWSAMRRLPAEKQDLEKRRASKALHSWAAKNFIAQEVTQRGIDRFNAAPEGDNIFAEFAASALVIDAGLMMEASTESKIEDCLEIMFYHPEPTANLRKIRQALQSIVTAKTPGTTSEERFTQVVIQGALASIDPALAGNPLIVAGVLELLSAGK